MKKIVTFLVLTTFVVSCVGMNINPAMLEGNHARGNFVNQTFLAAWADYQRYAQLTNLTPDAKVLLQQKRRILAEFVNPAYGPVILFNRMVEGSEVITDAVWNAMLDKLIELETGWYTTGDAYTGAAVAETQKLDPKVLLGKLPPEQQTEANLDKIIQAEAVLSGLRKDTGTGSQALWEGLLIELIRLGIHSLRSMIAQRNKTPEELAVMWEQSWGNVQSLKASELVIIQ